LTTHFEQRLSELAANVSDHTQAVTRLCERLDSLIERTNENKDSISEIRQALSVVEKEQIRQMAFDDRLKRIENSWSALTGPKLWLPFIIIGVVATGLVALTQF